MRIAPTAGPCWRGLAAAAALALQPAAAHADAGQGVNYSVGATLTHDDNLFRLAPGRNGVGQQHSPDSRSGKQPPRDHQPEPSLLNHCEDTEKRVNDLFARVELAVK